MRNIATDRLNPTGVLLLVLVSVALLAPGIGLDLADRDEAMYGQVIREMRDSGNWVVPYYLGKVWLGKPPMLYWLVGLSTRLLGWGEWQMRLVPLLATVASVLLAAWLATSLFDRRVGIWSGLIFVTFGLATVVGKLLISDSVLLTFILMAVALQWQMATSGVTHARAILHGLALGLGILTKGPVIIVFAGAFIIALLVAYPERRKSWLVNWRWWAWGGLFALVVAAPWYVYIYHTAHDTFVNQFITYEMTSRLTSRTQSNTPGFPGFYLVAGIECLLPWTVCIPLAVRAAVRKRREGAAYVLLLIWLAIPWVSLELLRGKVLTYTLPCYVSLAIMLAAELVRRFGPTNCAPTSDGQVSCVTRTSPWLFRLICLPIMLAGVAIIVGGTLYRHYSWGQAVMTLGTVIFLGFACAALLSRHVGIRAGCIAIVASAIATHAVTGELLSPSLQPYGYSRRVADALNGEMHSGDRIVLCGYKEPSLHFYTNKQITTIEPGILRDFIASTRNGPPTLLAVNERELETLNAAVREDLRPYIIREVVGYTHIKKLRWVRSDGEYRIRPDRMYIARLGAP